MRKKMKKRARLEMTNVQGLVITYVLFMIFKISLVNQGVSIVFMVPRYLRHSWDVRGDALDRLVRSFTSL